MGWYENMKPSLIMILVQIILVVVNISYKCALNDGMRLPVLVAYRSIFGAAFMLPLAFFIERGKRPKLTWKIIFYGFLCGLFVGSLGQNLYLKGLSLTSATFATAIMNLVPVMTFIVAICFRLEKLGLDSLAGKAKVFGTLMGIGGAMLLTFYKGAGLSVWKTNINLLEITSSHNHGPAPFHHSTVLGVLLSLASCLSFSFWLIFQTKAVEQYPCPYTFAAMMNVWSSIQSVVYAVSTENHWSNWIMGWDIRLFTTATTGILGCGVMFTLVAWCLRMRGPLFVAIFNPLVLVMVAIAGSLLLEEKLYVGTLLGAILIVGGLYSVLWGKGKELKQSSQLKTQHELEHEYENENENVGVNISK